MIWFVGAGCYHPDMLTIGAKKLLEQADCVLYDHLVNKEFLQYASKGCECICVGKRGHQRSCAQEDIFTLLLQKDKQYKNVVRLKGGDPYLFARGSEEMHYVLENGCNCQYVPGISSAIGALGYAGIPVTQRHTATGFIVHTMHYQDGKDHLDYKKIAQETNTQIFFMGSHKIKTLAQKCIDNGMSEDTPIAIGSHLTYPEQKIYTSTLKKILNKDLGSFTSPLLIVLGNVVKEQSLLDNTKRLPAFAKNVLFASIDENPWPIEDLLLRYGIFTYSRQVANVTYILDEILDLNLYDTLIFSSKHAVKSFFQYLSYNHIDIRSLFSKKIFCIGKKTQEELERRAIQVDHVESNSSDMFTYIKEHKNALYIKGKDVDCPIDSLSTYQIAPIEFDLPEVKLDAIGISCPQALEILDQKGIDKTTPVFCYAHKTYQKAKELEFTNIHTTPSSKQEIVKHILEYFGGNI